jgi:hypothetical protein
MFNVHDERFVSINILLFKKGKFFQTINVQFHSLSAASFKKHSLLDRPWNWTVYIILMWGIPVPPYESDNVYIKSYVCVISGECFRGNKRIILWRFIGIGKIIMYYQYRFSVLFGRSDAMAW